MIWTSTFHVLFTTRTVFSASLLSYCWCIIRTLCPIKIWSLGHYVLQDAPKTCNTDVYSAAKLHLIFLSFKFFFIYWFSIWQMQYLNEEFYNVWDHNGLKKKKRFDNPPQRPVQLMYMIELLTMIRYKCSFNPTSNKLVIRVMS